MLCISSQQRQASKMDLISRLPLGIIETILCRLPIQDAARTSILSREWRYHWINIPILAFIEDAFKVSTDGNELSVLEQTFDKPSKRKEMGARGKLFYAIYQVLLMHQGPIHEFTLSMDVDWSCVEIDHILLHLSKKNTVKVLKLDLRGEYKLPLCFFSLHQLTDLYLSQCALYLQPSFNRFGSLTTLCLETILTCAKTLLRLLSSCPLLKRLILNSDCAAINDCEDSTIVDLFKCLPVIEHLSLWFHIVLSFVPDRLPKVLPASVVHLKYLFVQYVCPSHKYGLPFLFLLIRSSPNLEKLKLEFVDESWLDEHEMCFFTLEGYSNIWLEHLNELEIVNFNVREKENEMDFVKLILAKSPALKKVRIFLEFKFSKNEKLRISKILSHSARASPVVKITVRHLESR